MRASLIFSSCLTLRARPISAWQYVTVDGLPSESLSQACIDAMVVDLSCPRQVGAFFEREALEVEALEDACTPECKTSLSDYHSSLVSDCGEDDVVVLDIDYEPQHISVIATDLYYHFNRTCIRDGNRWCHMWTLEQSEDQLDESSASPSASPTPSLDMCDNCVIKPFQFQAGQSYSEGFGLQPSYMSLTESCSKTEFPLATTWTDRPTTTSSGAPQPTCGGEDYIVKDGDTCQSISAAHDVATAWMLYDNNLPAFCAEFPSAGEKLCITNHCKTHVVQQNDTCQSIAKDARISQVQLWTWNPVIGASCNRLSLSVGDTICLEPPGDDDYVSPPTSITQSPPPTEPTAAPIPSDVADDTNRKCSQFYRVQQGDYCNKVVLKFSISMEDFLFLNQGVNQNCTDLLADISYCVAPLGPISLYPGHPDYVPPSSTVPELPFSELPKASFTPPTITGLPTKLPLAEGTRKDCSLYADGSELQVNMTYSFAFSACEVLWKAWSIDLEELENWNPSLNTTSSECAANEKLRYCMNAYDESTGTRPGPVPTETGTQLPIREGADEDCTTYLSVHKPMTCKSVLRMANITVAELYEMNPAVKSDCTGLWPDYRYCVSVE